MASKKQLKNLEGDGIDKTCFHLMVFFDHVRLQVNAGDVYRVKSIRELRKMANWLNKAADELKKDKS